MKLTNKFIFLIVSTSLVTLFALSYLVYTLTGETVSATISEGQLEQARQKLDKIDRLLDAKYAEIQVISSDHSIKTFLLGSQKDNVDMTRRMKELTLISGPWYDLQLFDTKGGLLFSQVEAPDPEDDMLDEEAEVYKKALVGEVVYSDVYYNPDINKPSMLFASPVRDDNAVGKPVVGVVIGHLAWPVVMEVLSYTNVREKVVDLYTRDGVEIANREGDFDALLKNDISEKEIFQEALVEGEGSEVEMSVDGEFESLTSFATEKGFAGYRGNGWVIIFETPTEVAFASATSSAIKITLRLIPVMVAGALLLVIFVIRFLKPIKSLIRVTAAYAAGDFKERAVVRSRDEIGTLGTEFNLMAEKLRTFYDALEQKIHDRTAELEKVNEMMKSNLAETERMNKLMIGRELKMIEMKKELAKLTEEKNNKPDVVQ